MIQMESARTEASPTENNVDPSLQTYCWMIVAPQRLWERDHSQIASDTLAFARAQVTIPEDLRDQADALFAEVKSRVRPRVKLDARNFAADMDPGTMIEYLLDAD